MAQISKFFSKKYADLEPYVPGEQPQGLSFVKLNTNESPFEPAPAVADAVAQESTNLNLYSDPECVRLRAEMSKVYGLAPEQILMTNGSDEALNFAFMAFADEESPLIFPDITYGFYPVFAQLNKIPYEAVSLREDFSIDAADYIGANKTIVIANPNAPTGLLLSLSVIEEIVASNPDNVVIIDEAYIDFGGKSARQLINEYSNLLVVGTFSKSKSLAGARLGFAFGCAELINAMNTIKYSTNPYNVNRLTNAAGIACLQNMDYYNNACKTIIENREWTTQQLQNFGFEVLPSRANFVFAQTAEIDGAALYEQLKARGVLVRHFTAERIANFNRISIGTKEQMEICIAKIDEILRGVRA